MDLGDGSVAGVRSEHAVSSGGAIGRVGNALHDTVVDHIVI